MKNNQKGFSTIEGTLILVIVALIGFIGWYIYDSKNTTDANLDAVTQSSNSKSSAKLPQTYTDPSGFTLKYPANWQFSARGSKDASGKGEFGFNQFVSKADYQAGNNASSIIFETDTTTGSAEKYAADYFAGKARPDVVVTSKTKKINGYDSQTVNYKLPSETPNGYGVFVVNNGKVVYFLYQDTETDKVNVPTYQAIINSIKFNN